jgi:hypothetical protein
VDRQQADEGIANDLPSVFCWVSVNQTTLPQRNQLVVVGKASVIETRSSGKAALHSHSAKSPKDGDISRRLLLSRKPAVSSVFRVES